MDSESYHKAESIYTGKTGIVIITLLLYSFGNLFVRLSMLLCRSGDGGGRGEGRGRGGGGGGGAWGKGERRQGIGAEFKT